MEKMENKGIFPLKMKELDPVDLIKFIFIKFWVVLLSIIIFGSAFFFYTALMVKPTYRSTFSAYVNNNNTQRADNSLTNGDITASQQLVKTYAQIITSRKILEASADSIGLDVDYRKLLNMVSTSQSNGTEIINVSVTAYSPEYAYNLSKAIAVTAPEYLETIVEGSSMKIIDDPTFPKSKYGPNIQKKTLLGIVIGIVFALAIDMIWYFTDNTVTNEKEIEESFQYPVVGIIPDIESITKSGYYSAYRYGYGTSQQKSIDNRRTK